MTPLAPKDRINFIARRLPAYIQDSTGAYKPTAEVLPFIALCYGVRVMDLKTEKAGKGYCVTLGNRDVAFVVPSPA